MQQAAKRGALRREQQFMLEIPVMELYPELESEETVLVQGIIDACFEEDGEWVLVDYKTDYVRYGMEQTLVDRYPGSVRTIRTCLGAAHRNESTGTDHLFVCTR